MRTDSRHMPRWRRRRPWIPPQWWHGGTAASNGTSLAPPSPRAEESLLAAWTPWGRLCSEPCSANVKEGVETASTTSSITELPHYKSSNLLFSRVAAILKDPIRYNTITIIIVPATLSLLLLCDGGSGGVVRRPLKKYPRCASHTRREGVCVLPLSRDDVQPQENIYMRWRDATVRGDPSVPGREGVASVGRNCPTVWARGDSSLYTCVNKPCRVVSRSSR